MSKKSRFKGPFEEQHGKRVQNTAAIWTTAPLPYLVIILNVMKSEKVCFIQMENLISVF